jgi:hypothetical protein
VMVIVRHVGVVGVGGCGGQIPAWFAASRTYKAEKLLRFIEPHKNRTNS